MSIYISRGGQQSGPFEESEVVERLRTGQLSPDDMAIVQGGTAWQKLGVMFPNVGGPPPAAAAPVANFVAEMPAKKGGGCFKAGLLTVGILLLLGGIGGAAVSRFVPSPSCQMLEQDAAELKRLQSKLQTAKDTPDEAMVKREIDQTISGMKASTQNCNDHRAIWDTVMYGGAAAAFVGFLMAIVGLLIGRRSSAG